MGFAGADGGLNGVEQLYNSALDVEIKEDFFLKSRKGQKTFGNLDSYSSEKEKLTLTLDITLQYKLFEELKKAIVDSKAAGGFA